jgi:electron transfer flavoprotein alpha subunit
VERPKCLINSFAVARRFVEARSMDFAVLIKVVPAVEKMRFDPARKTMVREGSELFINPFDQRAVRVALDARRPGERVSVLSMGPPAAEAALQETLALGADHAFLLSDPRLAGSDSLVTARVLAHALDRTGHDVVIAGAWTTDSETGQVGPEVAALLDVPFVGGARKWERDAEGGGWEFTVDTPSGWARLKTTAPLVFSVTEKIAKIRKPTPSELAASRNQPVERWTVEELGLDPQTVGLEGSPTVVANLVNEEPTREPIVLDAGTIAERVAETVEIAQHVLRSRPNLESRPPTPSLLLNDENEVLVLVSGPDGRTDSASVPFLTAVRRALPGFWPTAVWIGQVPTDDDRSQAQRSGATRGYHVPVAGDFVASHVAARGATNLLERRPRAAGFVFSAHPFGREVASQLAARRGLGLTGDAVGMKLGESGSLRWLKPAFGGGILAEIYSRTRPSLVTLRPGSFEAGMWDEKGPFEIFRIEGTSAPARVVRTDFGVERSTEWGDLDTARAVVSVGMGLGGPENVPRIRSLLEGTPFALAATRRVVDAGWVPRQLQVGLTGRSLGPDLAILVGVGGSTNHLVGWKRARLLVAVNADRNAPVLRGVDIGIVGNWEELLPPLLAALAPQLRTG